MYMLACKLILIFIFIITWMHLFVLPDGWLIWPKLTKLVIYIALSYALNQGYCPEIYCERLIAEVMK